MQQSATFGKAEGRKDGHLLPYNYYTRKQDGGSGIGCFFNNEGLQMSASSVDGQVRARTANSSHSA